MVPTNHAGIKALKAFMAAIVFLAVPSTAQAFTSCATLTLSTGTALLPAEQDDPAVSGTQNIYVSYSDASGLVFQASHDVGATWSHLILDPHGQSPRIAVVGKHIEVAWFTSPNLKQWSLAFAHSEDSGATFSTQNLGPGLFSLAQVAVSGPLFTVIYPSANRQVTVATSTDAGRTFHQVVLSGLPRAQEVYIEASKRNIAAIWSGTGTDGFTETLISTSKDAGRTFSPPVNMTPRGINAIEPQMAVSQETGDLYMIWREQNTSVGRSVGFLSKSTDFGTTWSTPLLIDPHDQRARQFAVAASGSNVYVTNLSRGPSRDWRTQLRISRDGGANFGPHLMLASTGVTGKLSDESHAPRIWAEKDWFRIVFDDKGTISAISSNDNGVHLAPKVALGPGKDALITRNSVLWLSDSDAAMFGQCR